MFLGLKGECQATLRSQEENTILATETLQSKTSEAGRGAGFQNSCQVMKYLEGCKKNGKRDLSIILTKEIWGGLVLAEPKSNSLSSKHFLYYCIYSQKRPEKGHPVIVIEENTPFFILLIKVWQHKNGRDWKPGQMALEKDTFLQFLWLFFPRKVKRIWKCLKCEQHQLIVWKWASINQAFISQREWGMLSMYSFAIKKTRQIGLLFAATDSGIYRTWGCVDLMPITTNYNERCSRTYEHFHFSIVEPWLIQSCSRASGVSLEHPVQVGRFRWATLSWMQWSCAALRPGPGPAQRFSSFFSEGKASVLVFLV